ncbi:GntR family transcriptional regulator [Oceanobacillus sojae]|uniref:XRE family transcriptional regulator n=1 Tax=Oceanobacillus sojae TaxID=582851 RepID=A0A511ZN08_9BACI|nr:UTRA domain-containing protein [Oceanobacillus sojae]MCT1901395.1 UTRA domain-containing protein [Oceanobacillus sojae]GEN88827.1 XRE family transcriptional regulator [Oceanobacillus sojae]
MLNNSLPLYKQIANKIKEDIIAASMNKGDAIPSELKLSKMYDVSRVTIRQAIKLLINEGLLYSVQGSGTYIGHERIDHNILQLQGFTEEMDNLQHDSKNEVLEFQLMTAPDEVRKILELEKEAKVYYIKRLRQADNEPLLVEESYLPSKLFPDLSINVMEKSKYQYIEQKGFQIDKRYGELIPILPTSELKSLLQLTEDTPLLYLKAFTTFKNGQRFEFSNVYYHPQKYNFKFISSK